MTVGIVDHCMHASSRAPPSSSSLLTLPSTLHTHQCVACVLSSSFEMATPENTKGLRRLSADWRRNGTYSCHELQTMMLLYFSRDSALSSTLYTGYFQKHATHSLDMYTPYSVAFHVHSGTRR